MHTGLGPIQAILQYIVGGGSSTSNRRGQHNISNWSDLPAGFRGSVGFISKARCNFIGFCDAAACRGIRIWIKKEQHDLSDPETFSYAGIWHKTVRNRIQSQWIWIRTVTNKIQNCQELNTKLYVTGYKTQCNRIKICTTRLQFKTVRHRKTVDLDTNSVDPD
jgi:hypothetical protein